MTSTRTTELSPHAHTGLVGAEFEAAGALTTRARDVADDVVRRQTLQRLRLEQARAAQFEEIG